MDRRQLTASRRYGMAGRWCWPISIGWQRSCSYNHSVSGFAEDVMACPTGLAWIATLELLATSGLPRAGIVEPLTTSTPAGVERAVELAATMPLGPLLHIASLGTDSISPWYDDERPRPVFAHARQRLPIAEAIASRADIDQLVLPGAATQWFWTDRRWPDGQVGEWLQLNESSNWFPNYGTVATCSPFPDESACQLSTHRSSASGTSAQGR
jgi:hypothetical protein